MAVRLSKGWAVVALRHCVSSIESGVSVNGDDEPAVGPAKGVLKVSAVSEGRFLPAENKRITSKDLTRARLNPRAGCLLMSRANTPELVGSVVYVDEDYPTLFLSDKLWQISLPENGCVCAKWLATVLGSDDYRRQLMELATGSSRSMRNISQKDFLALKIHAPPRDEQRRIVAVLDRCDEHIVLAKKALAGTRETLRRIVDRSVFSGVRNPSAFNLMRSKKLAADGWRRFEITEFAEEISRVNREGTALPVLSSTKLKGIVLASEYFGKQVHSSNTTTYKRARRGEFVYATNHVEEGSIGLQNVCDAGLVSPMYTVFGVDTKIVDADFLFALLKTETYRQIFEANTSASVNRRGSLRWKDFSRLPVYLPSLEAQQEITAKIATIQHLVGLQERRVDLLRQRKRGLMQKLLTGRWRLANDATGDLSDREMAHA